MSRSNPPDGTRSCNRCCLLLDGRCIAYGETPPPDFLEVANDCADWLDASNEALRRFILEETP
jgi:hypothetical protein